MTVMVYDHNTSYKCFKMLRLLCLYPLTAGTLLRLVDGGSNNEGRVEVNVDGTWGTICDDSWGMEDAHVICRQLGFPEALDARSNAHFGEGTGEIMYDDVDCSGNENHIRDCPKSDLRSHNC